MQEICAEQMSLGSSERGMRGEYVIHVTCTGVEGCQQVAMARLKVFQYLSQLMTRGLWIESQHPIDDVVRASAIRTVEVPRLGGGVEWAQYHPFGVRTQSNVVGFQEHRLQQTLGGLIGDWRSYRPRSRHARRWSRRPRASLKD